MTQSIDICICTFRRPHVAETMRSLAKLRVPADTDIRIIVADNDDTPSARTLIEATRAELSIPVTYIHAPARNISMARNACLNTATAPLLAFIDDDELVSEAWLNEMLSTLENTKADIVLGPVQAIYTPDCPEWIRTADFHSTKPVWVDKKIITGYAGNVMMKRQSPAIKGLRFRNELGRTGGEDTAFFAAAVKAGGQIAYAPEATATETIDNSRASMGWLLKRRIRSGQTHALMLLEESRGAFSSRLVNIGKASAKMLFCYIMALLNVLQADRRHFWLLRGAVHAGVILRLMGTKEIKLYG